jgi:hypothetical protein
MTKEEYFQTEWKSNLGSRAIDGSGREFYYSKTPVLGSTDWYLKYEQKETYHPDDVADWWRESLQTREEFLQLKNQTND